MVSRGVDDGAGVRTWKLENAVLGNWEKCRVWGLESGERIILE